MTNAPAALTNSPGRGRLGGLLRSERDCPGCNERRARVIWNESGYSYVRCRNCSIVYANITADEYREARCNAWDESVLPPEVTAFYGQARARAHREFLDAAGAPTVGGVLDVGCGLGYFLARATARGWDAHGVDTSGPWTDTTIGKVGRDQVTLGDVFSPDLDDRRFDLITTWDVIEHVFEPLPFLARIRELLAPSGALFIRTPNFHYAGPIYALRQSILRQSWATLGPTNHVVYFTAHTLRHLLQVAGLTITSWRGFSPPQVAVTGDATRRVPDRANLTVRARNLYSAGARELAVASLGRLVLTADLDAFARRA